MSTQTRPRHTTFAGGMIVGGSLIVLLTAWEAARTMRSIESRERVDSSLSEPPLAQLGLSTEAALEILRTTAAVAGACAAVALVLGVYALQGHRPARVGLSVLAVPLFLTGMVVGDFMSSVVAVAIGLLWLSPSREWFAGEPVPDSARGGAGRPGSDPPEAAVWPPPLPHDVDRAGESGIPSTGSTALASQPGAQHGSWPTWPSAPATSRRPERLTVAVVLTVVAAALVLLLTASSVVVMAVSPGTVMDELLRQQPDLAEQGVTLGTLRAVTFVLGGLVILWCATAIVLAVLTLRRRRLAAQALLVSAAVSAALCIVGTFASLVLALPAFASVIVVATLRRPDVRAWLAADEV